MKVPISWLKEYVELDLSAEQVATKVTMGGLEVEGIEESPIGPVLDVYVTPNRGDCLSVVGVAREVAALLGTTLELPSFGETEDGAKPVGIASVSIEDPDLCPRYSAQIINSVSIGPSPDWLRERLEAVGQRSVNNVVDVTNYVMLEMGQPLHAFDFDLLAGGRIIVRQAREGEKITTLDGEKRELASPMLVIADSESPVAIAGIMGGAASEVTDETTRILLESAHFSPLSVRRTSRTLALRTEASYRFERVVDPEGVVAAIRRCAELLRQMGAGTPVGGIIDVYPRVFPTRRLTLRARRASELLGMELDAETCTRCLTSLGFGVSHSTDDGALSVAVPSNRSDITIEEDLVEEVGRIYGYENIPETLPSGTTTRGGDSRLGEFISEIQGTLAACGMREVVTHSLTGPSFFDSPADASRRVAVRNALSAGVANLRQSLLPTLVDVAQSNSSRGQHDLALFEVGRIWQNEVMDTGEEPSAVEYLSVAGLMVGSHQRPSWRDGGKTKPADYVTIKGVVDRLLENLHIAEYTVRPVAERAEMIPQLHPGRSATISLGGGRPDGVIGELHPVIASKLDLRNRIYVFEISLESLQRMSRTSAVGYRPISRQQAVLRDIAPRVADNVTFAAVSAAIESGDIPYLSDYRLTDLYRGTPLPENVKSLTVALTFAHHPATPADDRAVSETEVNEALARIRAELVAKCGAEFPG
jgi:phenylalanyl-tRNA synthetase beta chain